MRVHNMCTPINTSALMLRSISTPILTNATAISGDNLAPLFGRYVTLIANMDKQTDQFEPGSMKGADRTPMRCPPS